MTSYFEFGAAMAAVIFPSSIKISSIVTEKALSRWTNLSEKNKTICSGAAAITTTAMLTFVGSTVAPAQNGFQLGGVIFCLLEGSLTADEIVKIDSKRMIASLSTGAIAALFGATLVNPVVGGLLGAAAAYSVGVIGASPLPASAVR